MLIYDNHKKYEYHQWLIEYNVHIAKSAYLEKAIYKDIYELFTNQTQLNSHRNEVWYYFSPFSRTSFMILEKLTDDADSLIFFACKLLSFFAISLFNMIVILSAIANQSLAVILNIQRCFVYKNVKQNTIFPFVEIPLCNP